jgi:hypothetical protein
MLLSALVDRGQSASLITKGTLRLLSEQAPLQRGKPTHETHRWYPEFRCDVFHPS